MSLTDARGSVTSYGYDSMERVASRTDPLLRPESYTDDPNGNPASLTDRKSQVRSSIYDGLNRLTQVTYGDASTTSYTYDAGNRLTQIVDSLGGTITRAYDGLDRLTQETTPQGSVSYTYDAGGRRTGMTVAGQAPVTYAYDTADRLTQIAQGTSTVGFTYDDANRRTRLTLPNGITTDSSYDAASRLTGLTYTAGTTTLGTLTYSYDAAGQRVATGGTWARTGQPQAMAGATYNAANHQLTFGGQTLTYDLNGNLTSDGTSSYTWNARNQLLAINGAAVTASFAYDGAGRRWRKTINGTSTDFLYDGLNPAQEASGGSIATLLTGLRMDEYFTRTDGSGARTLLTDALGSTVALADPAGAIETEHTYEAFGKGTSTGTPSGSAFQYTGRENDGTGLYYYRARYYHPGLQRLISEDPIGFAGGDVNLYAYVVNDPINLVDPSGLVRLGGTPAGLDTPECRGDSAPALSGRKDNLSEGAGLGAALGGFARGVARVLQCDPTLDLLPGGAMVRSVGKGLAGGVLRGLRGHGVDQAITRGRSGRIKFWMLSGIRSGRRGRWSTPRVEPRLNMWAKRRRSS